MAEFIAGADDEGRRCDRVVRRIMRGVPLTGVYAAMRRGDVRLNGRKVKGGKRVHEGDRIEVRGIERVASPLARNDGKAAPLPVLFQNEHLLVANKPAGVPTHGEGSIAEAVTRLWQSTKHSASLSFTPGPLHRLDRGTSGVLAFSQSLAGAKWFSEELKAHHIHKTYLTLLEGDVTQEEHWTDYIAPNEDYPAEQAPKRRQQGGNTPSFHIMQLTDKANGKAAITSVFPIVTNGSMTFARVIIGTGRKHQIRLQCATHGHPLAGDTAYGGAKGTLLLHAARLTFPPNDLGVPSAVDAPLPDTFIRMLDISFPNWRKCAIL